MSEVKIMGLALIVMNIIVIFIFSCILLTGDKLTGGLLALGTMLVLMAMFFKYIS